MVKDNTGPAECRTCDKPILDGSCQCADRCAKCHQWFSNAREDCTHKYIERDKMLTG